MTLRSPPEESSFEAQLTDVEVLRAYDASEGLELFELHKDEYLAVILDLLMPTGTKDVLKQDRQQGKMGGLRLAEEIRKRDRNIPLLALTSLEDDEVPPACRKWFRDHSRDWDGGGGWYSLKRGEERILVDRLSAHFATTNAAPQPQSVLIVHGRNLDSRKLLATFAKEKLRLKVLVFDELRGAVSRTSITSRRWPPRPTSHSSC